MLKEFRVTNFKSINKEQIFSMEACPAREISEFPNHVINHKGERLLKLSSFYGPNGGGKSNLLNAYITMIHIIMNSDIRNQSFGKENFWKCIFCNNPDSVFEVFLITENYEIGYSLTTDLNKIKEPQLNTLGSTLFPSVNYEIVGEEFIFKRIGEKDFVSLYTRNKQGIVKSDILKDIDFIKNSSVLPKNKTFISYFDNSFGSTSTSARFGPLFEFLSEIKGTVIFTRESMTYSFDESSVNLIRPHLKKVAEILNGVDIRVRKLDFKKTLPNAYCLYIYRETSDGKLSELQLASESKGTKKLINIIIDVLTNDNARIFLADDFDAYLHPKLIKVVIDLFATSDSKQLIMNSHDIVNMNNKTFRRDEIWFAYRDEDYSTKYIPLSNIVDYKGDMVRKDAVYGKQYLEGRFGADPFIKQGLEWE